MTSILKNANVGVLKIGPAYQAPDVPLALIITPSDSLLTDQTFLKWFYIGSFMYFINKLIPFVLFIDINFDKNQKWVENQTHSIKYTRVMSNASQELSAKNPEQSMLHFKVLKQKSENCSFVREWQIF